MKYALKESREEFRKILIWLEKSEANYWMKWNFVASGGEKNWNLLDFWYLIFREKDEESFNHTLPYLPLNGLLQIELDIFEPDKAMLFKLIWL